MIKNFVKQGKTMLRRSAIVVGGSNSVMKPGYLSAMVSSLKKYGIELEIIKNLAVGNTSSLTGLMNAKEAERDIVKADIILIEYSLNDSDIYKVNSGSFSEVDRWLKSAEGLLRYFRSVNPRAEVIAIILASKHGVHRRSVNPVHANVHYLAYYYDAHVIDVNVDLRKRFGGEFYDEAGVYMDAGHYARPVFTTICGETIASRLAPICTSIRELVVLPCPIHKGNLSGLHLLTSDRFSDLQSAKFGNSKFSETAFDLWDHTIHLSIHGGGVAGIKYICVEDVSELYIRVNGHWFSAKTLQPAMVEPNYPFLVSTIQLDRLAYKDGQNEISLTTIIPAEVTTEVPQHVAVHQMRKAQRLPICSIGYTGQIEALQVT